MPPVSAERGCVVDLSPAAIRPHLRRAGLPLLTERHRENRVQDQITILTYKVIHGLAPGPSAHSHVSPTYPVDDRCVLSAPIVAGPQI